MSVTNIVMLVKDRPRLTWQCLRSLAANTAEADYNLTIVDDGSTPEVYAALVEASSHSRRVALLRNATSKGITGQARNLGIYWAERYWGRGDWLYLADNDVYFTPGWLGQLVDTAAALRLSTPLIGGWNHPFLQPHIREYPYFTLTNGLKLQTHDAVTGASQLMAWATWDKHGPLDAHAVGVGQSEDWKFCQDIIKAGGKVGSVYPRVVLNCGVTNSFGKPSPGADIMLKELQEAKAKYPNLYWE